MNKNQCTNVVNRHTQTKFIILPKIRGTQPKQCVQSEISNISLKQQYDYNVKESQRVLPVPFCQGFLRHTHLAFSISQLPCNLSSFSKNKCKLFRILDVSHVTPLNHTFWRPQSFGLKLRVYMARKASGYAHVFSRDTNLAA